MDYLSAPGAPLPTFFPNGIHSSVRNRVFAILSSSLFGSPTINELGLEEMCIKGDISIGGLAFIRKTRNLPLHIPFTLFFSSDFSYRIQCKALFKFKFPEAAIRSGSGPIELKARLWAKAKHASPVVHVGL